MNALTCGMALAFLISGAAAAQDTVNSQITDTVTQADSLGPTAPSGRPWHRDNFVLRHEFREPAPIGDAMPTPVNGQVTDDVTTNIKSPGVYIDEENAFSNEVDENPNPQGD